MGNFISSVRGLASHVVAPALEPPRSGPINALSRPGSGLSSPRWRSISNFCALSPGAMRYWLGSVLPWPRRIRLPDEEEGGAPDSTGGVLAAAGSVARSRLGVRRALLVGISYRGELLNTHKDVDRYSTLLLDSYGYALEDVVVMKDDPNLPADLQPTRENLLRELRRLTSGATSGDRFTFLFSGHSNQQRSRDLNEEDFQDEYLITIDDEIIIDNDLNDILVKPLPAGCSLFALLDTCHSGTLLDLPHYHCNSIYVPWRSKGRRRTKSWQNVTVRRNAGMVQDFFLPTNSVTREPQSITSVLAHHIAPSVNERPRPSAFAMFVSIPLSIDARVAPAPQELGASHLREHTLPASPRICASPESRFPCNGWCLNACTEIVESPTVVSLAACSDYQRTWEARDRSLTTEVCSFLEKNKSPSYRELMTHVNFMLHATSLELHAWTRGEKARLKREAALEERGSAVQSQSTGNVGSEKDTAHDKAVFEGEMDNFQTPLLSSLVPLNMHDRLQL
ncbi:caspase domain-containing protein [Gloeopeniophorella convolvens]|nr:caspase domain-containing protein [Gloeopeniophorella convolvens]